ncbi:MAG: glycosyl hydrolase [Planctomycetota bacterium]|jgi:hypothetical protein
MAAKKASEPRAGFYREAPFWSWNDALDASEARRHIDEMAAGGWGGFFMHARPGLVTEYMGRKWMEVVKACVAHAKRRGMCAYLYDENRWPSGFAGGAVPKKGARYRAKYLMLSENLLEEGPNYRYMASFTAERRGRRLRAVAVNKGTKRTGSPVYHLYRYTAAMGEEWFLGTCYVDLLAPETTAEFIRTTHEKYRRVVGKEFGKTIPGIFTDEPALPFGHACPGPSVPWTPSLPKVFRERRGYDLAPYLLSLFLPCDDYRKVRYDFRRTVTEMFVENYMKQIHDWCEKHGLALTGHMMAEDTITSPARWGGQVQWAGAVMPFYEYMHIPGMDHLGRNVANPATAKQVSSVADQLGKERVLSELYGCSGQHFSLKGRKWIADWHFALGVNLLNPHLWLYTMRGARKRDFPPTISFQQPHWQKSGALSDRNALLSYILSRGQRVVDVLAVHPVESAWCDVTPMEPGAAAGRNEHFEALVDTLLAGHVDFHFGDESLMAKYGSVDEGELVIGEARYRVAVVPDCLTLRSTTACLLADFAAAGGTILITGRKPTLIDGARGGALLKKALGSARTVKLARLPAAIRRSVPRPVEVKGRNAAKVLCHLRDIGRERILFLANTDFDNAANLTVTVTTRDRFPGELDLQSGRTRAVAFKRRGRAVEFTARLAEAGSALFVLGPEPYRKTQRKRRPRRKVALGGSWRVKSVNENALTLDHVRFRRKRGGWSPQTYVLFAADELKRQGGEAVVRYEFHVGDLPQGPLNIAIERPRRWRITVNGRRVPSKDTGWFVDKTFRRIDITRQVRAGRNVVEVAGEVTDDFELESIYVVGDFSVKRRDDAFVIGRPVEVLRPGDICGQGFPFFAGVIEVERELNLGRKPAGALLSIGRLHNVGAAEVTVNGRDVGEILWPPYELELKGLRKGTNRIGLRLFGTLRNLLGPHHFEGPEFEFTSPGSFSDRKLWSDEYRFQPFGFEGAALYLT